MKQVTAKRNLNSLFEILLISFKLGLTSFGGPTAHLGYFHSEYVQKRKWLDEKSFADLVALCQFLPGPASSQVSIGIGVIRGGLIGGVLAFLGFTIPSVIVLILFAYFSKEMNIENIGWIHGLKIVAVAVVAQAIIGMLQKLAPDLHRKSIVLFAIITTILWQSAFIQVGIILMAGLFGFLTLQKENGYKELDVQFPISKRFATGCLILFFVLLFLLPIIKEVSAINWIALFDSFYRSGSLVFGGGHVVLPLLERELVPTGLISKEAFLAGYGAAQAVPGPLFTFAAYIGTVIHGWKGGLLATFAIFLPAFLLIIGTLPFWAQLRRSSKIQGALMGINAAVVGILITALYDPIWTSTILQPIDFAFVAVLYSMLVYWKLPPWLIVISGALGGYILSIFL